MVIVAIDKIEYNEKTGMVVCKNANKYIEKANTVVLSSQIITDSMGNVMCYTTLNVTDKDSKEEILKKFTEEALSDRDRAREKKNSLEEKYKDDNKKMALYFYMGIIRIKMAIKHEVEVFVPFTNEQLDKVIEGDFRDASSIMEIDGLGKVFKENYLDEFLQGLNHFYEHLDEHPNLDEYIKELKNKRSELLKEHKDAKTIWKTKRTTIGMH